MQNNRTVDSYIQVLKPEVASKLQQLRVAIKKSIPSAEDGMSYGVPALQLYGKNLLLYAAFKQHIGIYPGPATITAFKTELTGLTLAKGTIQFPLTKPLPIDLIVRIARYNQELLEIAQPQDAKSN